MSNGSPTQEFSTAEKPSPCSNANCTVKSNHAKLQVLGENFLYVDIIEFDLDINYNYDGVDVFDGTVSGKIIDNPPFSEMKVVKWTQSPSSFTAASGCKKCGKRAKCVEIAVLVEYTCGINLLRWIGISENKTLWYKFRICGDGSITYLNP